MPTYQYACTECGHGFEAVQSFSDDALTACPQCQGRLRKVFSSVGIVFKGSGFYRNDSREKSRAGTSDSTSDSSTSDSSKSGAKADLKPDSAPAKADAPAAKSTAKTSTDSSSGSSASSGGAAKPSRSSTEGSAA